MGMGQNPFFWIFWGIIIHQPAVLGYLGQQGFDTYSLSILQSDGYINLLIVAKFGFNPNAAKNSSIQKSVTWFWVNTLCCRVQTCSNPRNALEMWRTLLLSCLVFICIHPFPFTLCLKPDSRTPLNHFGLNNSPSQNSNYCNSCRFIHQLYSFVASIPILVADSLSCLFNSHFPNLRVPPNHPSHETLWVLKTMVKMGPTSQDLSAVQGLLLFEGGRWVWPGIREGFQRRVALPTAGEAPPWSIIGWWNMT